MDSGVRLDLYNKYLEKKKENIIISYTILVSVGWLDAMASKILKIVTAHGQMDQNVNNNQLYLLNKVAIICFIQIDDDKIGKNVHIMSIVAVGNKLFLNNDLLWTFAINENGMPPVRWAVFFFLLLNPNVSVNGRIGIAMLFHI